MSWLKSSSVMVRQNAVDCILQNRVALADRDADVDVFSALSLGSKLEIAVSAGEVQNDEVVVLRGSAHGGGHIGADEVDRTGLQLHDHGRSRLSGSQKLCAFDLRQAGVIPDRAGLRGALAAREVGNGGRKHRGCPSW